MPELMNPALDYKNEDESHWSPAEQDGWASVDPP
jgi:hypothetical protein